MRSSGITGWLLKFMASALLLVSCGAPTPGSNNHLRLAHGLNTEHPVHLALEHLAAEAARLSNGSLTITVYPSEQLGSERELVELLQIGSVAMTKISASVLENFDRRFSVLSVPYLFTDREHQFAALDGPAGTTLLEGLAPMRLRGLGFYDAGSRSFYTCESAIATPADLQGLKIRTQESASAMAMVNALGASPTPISWGELYTALSQGVVDGAENNPPSFYSSRHFEVCPHYTLDEHTSVPDVLVMSSVIWSTLSPEHKAVIEQTVRSSVDYQRTLWQEATQTALDQLEAAGVTVVRPDKQPFRASVEPLIREASNDAELAQLITQFSLTTTEDR